MPQFRYRAVNSQGHELDGTLSAPDANAAVVQLGRQGLRLKSIEEGAPLVQARTAPTAGTQGAPPVQLGQPPARTSVGQRTGPRFGARPSPRSTYTDRRFFFAQLGSLLGTGIAPADALHTVLSRSGSDKFRTEVNEMARMTSEGASLAEAMEHYPNMFTRGMVGAVRAGEKGGYLPDACMTVSEQQKETRNTFMVFAVLAFLLPLFIGGVLFGLAVAGGMNAGIDAVVEGDTGPAFQRGMLEAVSGYVVWLFVGVFGGGAAAYFIGRSVRFRGWRHRMGLATPLLRNRALNENLAHFSFHLGRLAKSGLSPFASWKLAAEAVPNQAYSRKVSSMADTMNENTRLSELLYRSRLFPRETAQLVETGEVTGNLPHAMDDVMEYGRAKEKQANTYLVFKAGCWTMLLFTVGGVIVFAIPYLTYLRGVFRILE